MESPKARYMTPKGTGSPEADEISEAFLNAVATVRCGGFVNQIFSVVDVLDQRF